MCRPHSHEEVKYHTPHMVSVVVVVVFCLNTVPDHCDEHTSDGVHYTPIYYQTAAQQVLNALPYKAQSLSINWHQVTSLFSL